MNILTIDFDWVMGDIIEAYNGEISAGSFSMIEPRSATLNFYRSLKPNPIFTFEKGVEKIAECKLDAEKDYPFGERYIKGYMK